jgi:hypothetical protein
VPGTSELEALIGRADLAGLHAWMRSADDTELAAARAWYVKGRRQTQLLYAWRPGDHAPRVPVDDWSTLWWIRALLAVGLAGPASAATWVPWTDLWERRTSEHAELVIDVACSRGEQWCREFVPRAAAVRMGERDLQLHAANMFRVLAAIIGTYSLPAPPGASFAVGWAQEYRAWPVTNPASRMVDDPLLPDVFLHLLASGFAVKLHCADDVAIELVRLGRLGRDRLVTQSIELLTTPQRVSTQRIIAKILAGLAITPDDLPGGLPLLQNLIATCHGSVVAVLMPFATRAISSEDDLVELCTTMAGRTERKQQKDLIASLTKYFAPRLGTAPAIAGLEVFRSAATDDPQLLTLVERALERLGAAVEHPSELPDAATGLWQLDPPGQPFFAPRVVLVDDREQVDLAYARAAGGGLRDQEQPDIDVDISPELLLGELVRRAHAESADSVRAWLALLPWRTDWVRHDPILEGVHDGQAEPGIEAYVTSVHRAGCIALDVTTRQLAPPYALSFWPQAFRYLLARESMLRLGRTPGLLSTPTRGDGTIDFDDLVFRLRTAQAGVGFGPLDLLQALLRLRTPAPERTDELAGLHVPLDPVVDVPHLTCRLPDGVGAVREWVQSGGLPPVTGEPSAYGPATRTCELPILAESFGTLPPEAYQPGFSDPFAQGVVVPRWWELSIGGYTRGKPRYTRKELAAGPLAYIDLLRKMASDRAEDRETAGRTALKIMGEQRFDPAGFAACMVERLGARDLRIKRVISVWDLMAGAGGLRLLWPAALAITARAVTTRPLPTATHELLAWLTRYVAEVPDPDLPEEIAAFARGRGSTKSHYEARALLDSARGSVPA